jgi:hypothetical protein
MTKAKKKKSKEEVAMAAKAKRPLTMVATLQLISTKARPRLGFVFPYELILTIISMIFDYCESLQRDPQRFVDQVKQPGWFVRTWLCVRIDRFLRESIEPHVPPKFGWQYDRGKTARVLADVMLTQCQETPESDLKDFQAKVCAVMRGAKPEEVG